MKKSSLLILLFLLLTIFLKAKDIKSDLHKRLLAIPNLTVKAIKADSNFSEAFEIFITQPVDHLNPNNGPKFKQKIYLRHVDYNMPMVFNNEGYATNADRRTELGKILKCNEMFVEHRYFGDSKPDTINWTYLTTAQAAADHNRIVNLFKSIYKGKWISTGISKGGQTTIFFKYYYPDAVDVWVPYVAPLNFEQEESRIQTFLKTVGSNECRNKIVKYQRELLTNRKAILPLLKEYMHEKNYVFEMGIDKTFEYAVLEYPFSFWQWENLDCDDIPIFGASPKVLFKHLYTVSSLEYFDSTSMAYYLPFFYQAYTEIGYYGYDTRKLADLLVNVNNEYVSNICFAPQNIKLNFNKNLMRNINEFIYEHGNNMLYIYGGNDTWSASSVNVGPKTNAVKMIKLNGSHKTRINSFVGAQKEIIYSTLEKWLNVKIER